jgi:hypothetical protein
MGKPLLVTRASFAALCGVIPEASTFTAAFAAIADLYLSRFALPSDITAIRPQYPCLKCGSPYGGFRWGLQHGCGSCSTCGWPARAYHFVIDENGDERRLVIVLQYHPDEVKVARKSSARRAGRATPQAE